MTYNKGAVVSQAVFSHDMTAPQTEALTLDKYQYIPSRQHQHPLLIFNFLKALKSFKRIKITITERNVSIANEPTYIDCMPKSFGNIAIRGMYKNNCLPSPIAIAGVALFIEGQKVIAVIVTERSGAIDINILKLKIYCSSKLTCGNILPITSQGLIIDISQNGNIMINAAIENILNELILLSYFSAP